MFGGRSSTGIFKYGYNIIKNSILMKVRPKSLPNQTSDSLCNNNNNNNLINSTGAHDSSQNLSERTNSSSKEDPIPLQEAAAYESEEALSALSWDSSSDTQISESSSTMQCKNLVNDLEQILKNDPPSRRLKLELLRLIEPKLSQESEPTSLHQDLQEAMTSSGAQSAKRRSHRDRSQHNDLVAASNLRKRSETSILREEFVNNSAIAQQKQHNFQSQGNRQRNMPTPQNNLQIHSQATHASTQPAPDAKRSGKQIIQPSYYEYNAPIPKNHIQPHASKHQNTGRLAAKHAQPVGQRRDLQAENSRSSLRSHSQERIPIQLLRTNTQRTKEPMPPRMHESNQQATQQNIRFVQPRLETEPRTFVPYLTNKIHMETNPRKHKPKQDYYSHQMLAQHNKLRIEPTSSPLEARVRNNNRYLDPSQHDSYEIPPQVLAKLKERANNIQIPKDPKHYPPKNEDYRRYNIELQRSNLLPQATSNSLEAHASDNSDISAEHIQQRQHLSAPPQTFIQLGDVTNNIRIATEAMPSTQDDFYQYNMEVQRSDLPKRIISNSIETLTTNGNSTLIKPEQQHNRCQVQTQTHNSLETLANNIHMAPKSNQDKSKSQCNHKYNIETGQISFSAQSTPKSLHTLPSNNKIRFAQPSQQHNRWQTQSRTLTTLEPLASNIHLTSESSPKLEPQSSRGCNNRNAQNSLLTQPISNSLETLVMKSQRRCAQPRQQHDHHHIQPRALTSLEALARNIRMATESMQNKLKQQSHHRYIMGEPQNSFLSQPVSNSLEALTINSKFSSTQQRESHDCCQVQQQTFTSPDALTNGTQRATGLNQEKPRQHNYRVYKSVNGEVTQRNMPTRSISNSFETLDGGVLSKHARQQYGYCQPQRQNFVPLEKINSNFQMANDARHHKQKQQVQYQSNVDTQKTGLPMQSSSNLLESFDPNRNFRSIQLREQCDSYQVRSQRLSPLGEMIHNIRMATQPMQEEVKQGHGMHDITVERIKLPQHLFSNSLETLTINSKSRSVLNQQRDYYQSSMQVPRSHSQTWQQMSNLQRRTQQTQTDAVETNNQQQPMDVHVIPEDFFNTGEVSIELNRSEYVQSSDQPTNKSYHVKFSEHAEQTPIHFDVYPQRSDMSVISNVSTQCTPLTIREAIKSQTRVSGTLSGKSGSKIFTEVSFREMEKKIKQWKVKVARNIATLRKLSNEKSAKDSDNKPSKSMLGNGQKGQGPSSDLPCCSCNKTKKY